MGTFCEGGGGQQDQGSRVAAPGWPDLTSPSLDVWGFAAMWRHRTRWLTAPPWEIGSLSGSYRLVYFVSLWCAEFSVRGGERVESTFE